MKRLVLSLFGVVYALSFAACEPHSVDKLPEHYKEKEAGYHEGAEPEKGKKGEHHAEKHEGEAKSTEGEKAR